VVATSRSAADGLVGRGLDPARVHVAEPGVEPAPPAAGTDGAGRLLCVASVTPRKGQVELVEALAELVDRSWTLVCAGSVHRDPQYVTTLSSRISRLGLGQRVLLMGPRVGAELDALYDAADLVVLTSWAETYGMVVTEALARGIPVLASTAGALPDTVGYAPDGSRPGMLVEPGDHHGLVAALRGWFGDSSYRYRLRKSADDRRAILLGWEHTARSAHEVLERLRCEPLEAPS
jgi:glycosyltransferase involved in cell wall biosynthesis